MGFRLLIRGLNEHLQDISLTFLPGVLGIQSCHFLGHQESMLRVPGFDYHESSAFCVIMLKGKSV